MTNSTAEQSGELRLVPLDTITIAEGANPRKRFDDDGLRELADSITKHGLIQPLVVRSLF